ncbi:MAG: pyruvate kinase [Roseburia sp.]
MHTKIYGTIGPACHQTDTLVRLFEKGMTGIRINLSHSSLDEAKEWIDNIHEAYKLCGGNPEILMDLRGPELRIGKLSSVRRWEVGEVMTLVGEGANNLFDPAEIPVPQLILPFLVADREVMMDDGRILLKVEEQFRDKNKVAAKCSVVRGGILKSGKSIALTSSKLYPPTLTESDLHNISRIKRYGITGVMLPFVRNKEDLENLKQNLKKYEVEETRIFAKIENMDGVKCIEELLPHCDEIVVARGDLGNAIPLWELPVVQERIAGICRAQNKPFMVVTQMLASMEESAVPTRAEVSDIFRAVREGAASVMLTGETAAGRYPVEAMMYMANTVRAAERS